MITGVGKVVVAVDDQDKAKAFWTDQIGFDATRDEPYGDERWIEVTPPEGPLSLVLSRRPPQEPRRQVPEELAHSDLIFTCDDLQQTYQELTARGVRFPAPPTRMPFGWWSMFADPDGTRYALGQQDSR
jgi:predicted enzyme related to lactoylglutathione lyase